MTELAIKPREQIVEDEIAAIQAALPGTFQFPVGSIVRAITESHARTALWEESLVQYVQSLTRLSTSTGNNVDTFVDDFGYARQAGVAASGNVTFSSFSTTQLRVVPVGSTVSLVDGSVSFTVYVDTDNVNYDPSLNGYVLESGTASILVPVRCNTVGTAGNVNAGLITVINSPITGVDNVTNLSAFSNGLNQAGDPSVKTGFISYLNGLKRAAIGALEYAIESVQAGIDYKLVENIDYSTDVERRGYFYAVIDDGTGTPPDSLVESVYNSLLIYKGFTIRFEVEKVVTVNVNVTGNVLLPENYTSSTLADNIDAAIRAYINLIPIGGTLYYTRLADIVYQQIKTDAPDRILEFNVTGILANGGTADIASTTKQSLYPGTVTFTLIPPA